MFCNLIGVDCKSDSEWSTSEAPHSVSGGSGKPAYLKGGLCKYIYITTVELYAGYLIAAMFMHWDNPQQPHSISFSVTTMEYAICHVMFVIPYCVTI